MAEEKKNELTFSGILSEKLISMEDALPKNFNRTRFVQNAISVINEKPELQAVNKNQLMMGLIKGACLNLDFSNREFYLIPYGKSVQFQFDYRGLEKIVKQYSIRPIKDIYAKIVREGDVFTCDIKDNNTIVNFSPIPFSDNKIIGVFAVVEYMDGVVNVETMSTAEVENVRNNYSKQKNGKTWVNSWDQMAIKTCIRRLCKNIEISFESAEAKNVYEQESGFEFSEKEERGSTDDPFQEEVFVECEQS